MNTTQGTVAVNKDDLPILVLDMLELLSPTDLVHVIKKVGEILYKG